MAEFRILLLGQDGRDGYAALPDGHPISTFRDTIAQIVGLPSDNELVLRKVDGSIINQERSLSAARLRADDLVLVELPQVTRRWGRQRVLPPEPVLQSGYRVLPCYLVIDTSRSMAGEPISTVNREVPLLRARMRTEPELVEVCQLSVITFDVRAKVHVPLTKVNAMTFTDLRAEGARTDYSQPFTLLRQAISRDLYSLFRTGSRPYRPVVFFLSDGKHNAADAWLPAFTALTSRTSFFGAPNVIAFGFGDALEATIWQIGTKAAYMPADGSPAAKLETFLKFLLSSLALSMTTASTDEDDPLVVPPDAPVGWRQVRIER